VWHGTAGELSQAGAPCTEADPIGVHLQALVAFGNLLGRGAYWRIGATRHHANLFACTVGPTALGRKGMAWDEARRPVAACDEFWAASCIKGGLSSGEGLIWAVHDPIVRREPIKEKGRVVDYQDVEVDQGVKDKRLLVVETELAATFKVMNREGNQLSAIIRQAWDSGDLRTLTKNTPAVATGAHISIIGHITDAEVTRHLGEVEAANGFGNRFLWAAVRRPHLLPFGGDVPPDRLAPILVHFKDALARHVETTKFAPDGAYEVPLADAARPAWETFYREANRPRTGLLGAILGRAAPITMRLAMIYAVLDRAWEIGPPHLAAATALWQYAERSVAYIFGESMGDPDADTVLDALRSSPGGLTQTQIYSDLFQRHRGAKAIARILGRLRDAALVRREVEPTAGRPATRWFATGSP
jgi:hypothetical protein